MDSPVNAKIRLTKWTLLSYLPAALFGLAVGWGFGLLLGQFVPEMSSLFLKVEVIVVAVVGACVFAIALIVTHRGFASTEVWTEGGQLVVRTPGTWWLEPTEQFRLTVGSVERAAAGVEVTGTLSRWWDWGRYKIRIDSGEGEALEVRVAKIEQE